MPANHRRFGTPREVHTATANRDIADCPLRAYVRHLHETSGRQATDEPVRGRDPWRGIGL